MKLIFQIIVFLSFLSIHIVIISESAICYEVSDSLVMSTTEEAIQRADQYTGFLDKIPGKNISEKNVELITMVDSTTPFLSKFTDGKAVWKVKFEDVLVFDNKEKNREGIPCDFEVYIDSVNGRLLKIESNLKPLDPYEDPEISAEEAERQISGGGEMYICLPDSLPLHSFVDILPTQFINAKNMVAQYVYYGQEYISPRSCWIVTLRGIPPIHPIGGPADWLPVYTRNRFRYVINSTTGRLKYSTSVPNLGISEEDKKRLFPDGFK